MNTKSLALLHRLKTIKINKQNKFDSKIFGSKNQELYRVEL